MVVVFSNVGASIFFLLLRYMKKETIILFRKNIHLTHNLDFIDAVGIVASYFKAILTPMIASIILLTMFGDSDKIPIKMSEYDYKMLWVQVS